MPADRSHRHGCNRAHPEAVTAWIAAPAPAVRPDAGTILTPADHELIAALLPPGYADEFAFDGAELEIQAPMTFRPPPVYAKATARFAGEARISADGALENYTAGQPFNDAQIMAASPAQAGCMIAWNRIHCWQHAGWRSVAIMMAYIRATPAGSVGTLVEGLEVGGNAERDVTQNCYRVHLSRLGMHTDSGYRIEASDSAKHLYKDYVEFFEPCDVQGTKFVIERSHDPHEEDQFNSSLPTPRRVRRLSAEERADSFMGARISRSMTSKASRVESSMTAGPISVDARCSVSSTPARLYPASSGRRAASLTIGGRSDPAMGSNSRPWGTAARTRARPSSSTSRPSMQ